MTKNVDTPTLLTKEAAFAAEMEGRLYGPDETADARAWYFAGWMAARRVIPVGVAEPPPPPAAPEPHGLVLHAPPSAPPAEQPTHQHSCAYCFPGPCPEDCGVCPNCADLSGGRPMTLRECAEAEEPAEQDTADGVEEALAWFDQWADGAGVDGYHRFHGKRLAAEVRRLRAGAPH